MNVKETLKKFGWRIVAGVTCVAACVLSVIIRERNSTYRKRSREIEELVDTAGDYNQSAQEGIEDAIRIIQKARARSRKKKD